jgi:hypothetical protein
VLLQVALVQAPAQQQVRLGGKGLQADEAGGRHDRASAASVRAQAQQFEGRVHARQGEGVGAAGCWQSCN